MDDVSLTCPTCGAGVRPDQEWCTLCLHVLRAPEPATTAVTTTTTTTAPVPVSTLSLTTPTGSPTGATGAMGATGPTPFGTPAPAVSPEVEAAAEALLAQLAVATRKDRLAVPSFLDSKIKVAVSVTVGMCVFSAVVLVAFSLLGAVLR